MTVVWSGRGSLHDLYTSQRDQLLFQTRNWALGDHAPAVMRKAPPARATPPRKPAGRKPVLALRETCADCQQPLPRPRARKGWSRCQPCSAANREALAKARWALTAQVHALVRDGLTYRRIAASVGISMQQVGRLAQLPEWPTLEARREAWLALQRSGVSLADIAWRYRVSPSLVSRELAKP